MELWFSERQTPEVSFSCRVRQTLHTERTPYQDLAVVETAAFGRMLVLDGMVQTTEADEFAYHEMMCHVPLFTHPDPRRVAIIGGGDGGAVREVLRHPGVEKVTLVEIDGRVVEVCRRFLPKLAGALDDPRVEVRIEDGKEHVAGVRGAYDVLLVDSTEPVREAAGLFTAGFYGQAARALAPGGILVAQTESPYFNRDLLGRAVRAMRTAFPLVRLYLASVPTYPSGLWTFTLGSLGPDPLAVRPPSPLPFPTRYYTPGLHQAAFQLPRFIEELASLNPAPATLKPAGAPGGR